MNLLLLLLALRILALDGPPCETCIHCKYGLDRCPFHS